MVNQSSATRFKDVYLTKNIKIQEKNVNIFGANTRKLVGEKQNIELAKKKIRFIADENSMCISEQKTQHWQNWLAFGFPPPGQLLFSWSVCGPPLSHKYYHTANPSSIAPLVLTLRGQPRQKKQKCVSHLYPLITSPRYASKERQNPGERNVLET